MTGGQSWHPPSHIFFEFLPVVPIIKSRKISKFYAITQTSLQVWSLSQNSQFQTFQVFRFCFVSPGLLVNKSKPPGYYKLVKSPGFFTFISRFFLLFTCFSALLLIFCIEKLELSHPLSVIGFESGFCLHPIRNSDSEIISKMASKNAHKDSSNLYEELVCPLYISGQWSNGSASQRFAFGANLPVLS